MRILLQLLTTCLLCNACYSDHSNADRGIHSKPYLPPPKSTPSISLYTNENPRFECSTDSKRCSDGSYVMRLPTLQCRFAECPK